MLAARELITARLSNIYLALAVEILVGMIVYPAATMLFARSISKNVISWVRHSSR